MHFEGARLFSLLLHQSFSHLLWLPFHYWLLIRDSFHAFTACRVGVSEITWMLQPRVQGLAHGMAHDSCIYIPLYHHCHSGSIKILPIHTLWHPSSMHDDSLSDVQSHSPPSIWWVQLSFYRHTALHLAFYDMTPQWLGLVPGSCKAYSKDISMYLVDVTANSPLRAAITGSLSKSSL